MENKRVENYTRNPYYEQVVSVGLTLLNIPEKVRVQIKQFINRLSTWDCQIAALAQPCPYDENIYELYVDPSIPDMEIGEMIGYCISISIISSKERNNIRLLIII